MSAQILLKSGKTDPPKGALNERELGINTSTSELFIGTSSGEAKQIASVPFVYSLFSQGSKVSGYQDISTTKTYTLNDNYIGIFIVQKGLQCNWYAVCQCENSISYNPIINNIDSVNISIQDNTLSIQDEGSILMAVTFCGAIS